MGRMASIYTVAVATTPTLIYAANSRRVGVVIGNDLTNSVHISNNPLMAQSAGLLLPAFTRPFRFDSG